MQNCAWKQIKNYEGIYEISSNGNVRRAKMRNADGSEIIISQHISNSGYFRAQLSANGKKRKFSVHRLVADSFIGNIGSGFCVNHIDGNKTNNNVENLEIITYSENSRHAIKSLGWKPPPFKDKYMGESSGRSKLTDAAVIEIRGTPKKMGRIKFLSEKFGVSIRTISYVLSCESWAHIK